jgi:hypothetical protein
VQLCKTRRTMVVQNSQDIRPEMRIGFLFNHDQVHQIAHSLPIALACAKQAKGWEVMVVVTNELLADEILRLAGGTLPPELNLVRLRAQSPATKLVKQLLDRVIPAGKFLIYRDNLDFFKSLDAIVVTERTSLMLKSRYNITQPAMILADHGAGDRAIGFDEKAAHFDHILAAGPKIRDRMIAEAGVSPENISVTGYPKFDLFPPAKVRPKLFPNDRPTVVYNPHVSPHLSSWYRLGEEVLNWFVDHPDYNLIFAPHIMLFERRMAMSIDKLRIARTGTIPAAARNAPNILIDTGSAKLTDMSYTEAADIYLGDVSSQIYEFLRTPRPCLFLDTQEQQWQGDPNFAHWQSGPVIKSVEMLGSGLEQAVAGHVSHFKAQQQRLFDYTFLTDSKPAGERAAARLLEWLGARD